MGTAVRYVAPQGEVKAIVAGYETYDDARDRGGVYRLRFPAVDGRPEQTKKVNAANVLVRRPADGSFLRGDLVLARTDPDADPVEGYIQGKGAVPCSYSVLVPGQTGVVDVHESLIERTGATYLLQASGFTQEGNGDCAALLKSKLQV